MEDCIIFVRTEEESARVQKVLHAAGAARPYIGKVVSGTEYPFIYVTNNLIHNGTWFSTVRQGYENHSFLDSHNVDSATDFPPLQPEVMITVDGRTISEPSVKAALKAHYGMDWPK